MSTKKIIFVVLGTLLILSACANELRISDPSRDIFDPAHGNTIGSIVGYNHTDEYIHRFYVDGKMGPNIRPHSGGGATTCCAVFPKQWRENMKVKVEWTTPPGKSTENNSVENWHEKSVPLGKYGPEGGSMQVHFLPNREVVVVISNLYEESPNYPGPKLDRIKAGNPQPKEHNK